MGILRALIAGVSMMAVPSAGYAAAPCTAVRSAGPPAVVERVICDQAAISRYFLVSPALAALSASARAQVVAEPLRYAFAYMSADAIDRLHRAFAAAATQSVELTEILRGRDTKGRPEDHELFELQARRADIAGLAWSSLTAGQLFQRVPSMISPYLRQGLAAEQAKSAAK